MTLSTLPILFIPYLPFLPFDNTDFKGIWDHLRSSIAKYLYLFGMSTQRNKFRWFERHSYEKKKKHNLIRHFNLIFMRLNKARAWAPWKMCVFHVTMYFAFDLFVQLYSSFIWNGTIIFSFWRKKHYFLVR